MKREIQEEIIRSEIEEQAEKLGIQYSSLSDKAKLRLRNLVVAQLYSKDGNPSESPQTVDEG